jgi:cobalt-zinc-cadmium efflux system outer membrane protein
MTRAAWAAWLLLAGCTPATVDYPALERAAAARQRWQDSSRSTRDTAQLLAEPLTADASARLALLNHRGARAAAQDLGIAQAELSAVRRLPNPELDAALRFHGGDTPELELGAMIDVSALLLTLSRAGAVEADVTAAKLEAVGVMVDASFDARRAFIEFQAASEVLELRQRLLAAFEAAASVAEQLRQAGNATELDLLTERAARERARLEAEGARTDVALARERLNAAMGINEDQRRWTAAGKLPELPARELLLDELEQYALRASLDLAAAKHRYAAASKQAGLASVSGFLPELKAGVSAERADDWSVGPAVALELPIFYQGQGEAGAARARARQALDHYASTAVDVRSAAREARAALEAARRNVVHARDVLVPLGDQVLAQAQLEYNGMQVGVFQLLAAKREALAAAEQLVLLRREYWLARLRAEQLLAGRVAEHAPRALTAPRASLAPRRAH